jgi:hypothetical protein
MAGRGPAPKNPATRQRKNVKLSAAVLVADPNRRVPSLPKHLTMVTYDEEIVDRKWHPQTKAEWRAIWHSGVASQFDDADLAGLYKLVVLIDDYWHASGPAERNKLSAEIRLQRLEFGLTPVARQRLAWETARADAAAVKKPKPPPLSAAVDPRVALGQQPLRLVEGGGESPAA